jgi:hypothetical protein
MKNQELEFFSLQNETKLNKISYYGLFFDFFMFQSKRLVGVKQKCHNSKTGGYLQAGTFLKYWKKPEHSSCQDRREKRSLVNKNTFFFASIWKKANY